LFAVAVTGQEVNAKLIAFVKIVAAVILVLFMFLLQNVETGLPISIEHDFKFLVLLPPRS
jgi:hypothetical protein